MEEEGQRLAALPDSQRLQALKQMLAKLPDSCGCLLESLDKAINKLALEEQAANVEMIGVISKEGAVVADLKRRGIR